MKVTTPARNDTHLLIKSHWNSNSSIHARVNQHITPAQHVLKRSHGHQSRLRQICYSGIPKATIMRACDLLMESCGGNDRKSHEAAARFRRVASFPALESAGQSSVLSAATAWGVSHRHPCLGDENKRAWRESLTRRCGIIAKQHAMADTVKTFSH